MAKHGEIGKGLGAVLVTKAGSDFLKGPVFITRRPIARGTEVSKSMVEISDRLRCLFSTSLESRGDSYVLEIPREELEQGEVANGETYRVAVLPQADSQPTTQKESQRQHGTPNDSELTPPVEEGEQREVEIETMGDQGDGIAKVERGYVLIVPGARPGDKVTVEIENVRQNVAFARVVDEAVTGATVESTESVSNQSEPDSQPTSLDTDEVE